MLSNKLLNNRYEITKKLHETYFSKTFEGIETARLTDRKCLIKQLTIDPNNPQEQKVKEKRFKKEAETLEKLGKHAQIPDLYDYFYQNNQFFLVQEWIEGQNLEQTVKNRGQLAESEVKDIIIQLLPVLGLIHNQHQIIHRDIKPSNIMLNAKGLPVLIDFGIIKEIVNRVNPNTPFTVSVGTPGFIAPEQALGQPVAASDLYSLGLTAIYLLTGKLPNYFKRVKGQLLWRTNSPNISQQFADVLDKAIQLDLSDRYSTAKEMLSAMKKTNIATKLLFASYKSWENTSWLKIVTVPILAGIVSSVGIIFYNNINQPKPTETSRQEIITREILYAATQKAATAINKAKTATEKTELETAINELERAIQELENIPQGKGVDDEIQAKQSEYGGIIYRINEALNKQPCYELLWKTDDCQEYPPPLF